MKPKSTAVVVPGATKKEKALTVDLGKLQVQVDRCKIVSDADAEKATSLASMVADLLKKAEAERKELVDPLNAVVKKINERYKNNLTGPLEAAKENLKAKIGEFMFARQRAEELRQQKLLEQQEAAEKRGAKTRATNLQVLAEASGAKAAAAGKVRGLVGGSAGLRKVWDWEVTDVRLVPVDMLQLNDAAVRAALDSLRAEGVPDKDIEFRVAGIRFFQKNSVHLR